MENTNIAKKSKKKMWKKILLISLITVFVAGIAVGGYFLYKYLFPTDKELFIIACENTLEDLKNSKEPERFKNTSVLTFDTEGEFSNPKASDALGTAAVTVDMTKTAKDKKQCNISIDFLDSEFLTAQYTKVGNTEALSIPQLAEGSFCADSYLDILSLVLGSAKSTDVDLTEGFDEKQLEKYYDKYTKKLYKNIPDADFSSKESGNIKIITLKTDLDRAAYDVLTEMKNDKEFCNFLYEQTNLVANNIKRKHPYLSVFISVPQKSEFSQNYKANIDNLIKSIENAEITITINVNKERRIEKTQLKITDNGKEIFSLIRSPQQFDVLVNGEDKMLFKLESTTIENGSITEQNTTLSFDVNDLTKEKTETPKLVLVNLNSKTDTNVSQEINLPQDCTDIRTAPQEVKDNITKQASEKFVEVLTGLFTQLFS